jgi:hypothetical protein
VDVKFEEHIKGACMAYAQMACLHNEAEEDAAAIEADE